MLTDHRRRLSVLLLAILAVPSQVLALNVNPSSVRGLSQAYGFIIGQEHTLERISKQYSGLAPRVQLARARFASSFPDIKAGLEAELRRALGAEKFDQFAANLADNLRATLDRQPLTAETAADFLDQVQARSGGEIESPVLEYLLAVKYASSPAREFLDGFRQRFRTDGTGKSRGMKLSLQLPRSWAAQEGERPHIVKKWTSENGTGLESIMLDTRDAEGYNPDRREIERFLRSGEVKQAVPQGAVYIESGTFTIEGRPGYWTHMKMTQERTGVEIYQGIVMYQAFFRGRAIGIMCHAGGPRRHAARVDETLKRIRPLCEQVVNSIVLEQAY